MATNLQALLKRAKSLSGERAQALTAADMVENADRYSRANPSSEAMDSEFTPADEHADRHEGGFNLPKP